MHTVADEEFANVEETLLGGSIEGRGNLFRVDVGRALALGKKKLNHWPRGGCQLKEEVAPLT